MSEYVCPNSDLQSQGQLTLANCHPSFQLNNNKLDIDGGMVAEAGDFAKDANLELCMQHSTNQLMIFMSFAIVLFCFFIVPPFTSTHHTCCPSYIY